MTSAEGAEAFDRLLEVQDHDTALDRLLHRRQTLPERQDLAAIEARIARLSGDLQHAVSRRDEVAGRQADLESQLEAAEARIGVIDKRMYSGEVSASRDLQAMAAEIESLRRRVSALEDQALETMEEREPFDGEVAALETERVALESRAAEIRESIRAAEALIDADAAAERAARDAAGVSLPPELSGTYERLRSRLGGVGAARLENGSCTGCHLRLPAIEADRLRKLSPDALVFCEQCGRILVRSTGRPGTTAGPAT